MLKNNPFHTHSQNTVQSKEVNIDYSHMLTCLRRQQPNELKSTTTMLKTDPET